MGMAGPGAADVADGRRRRRIPLAWASYLVLAALVAVTLLVGLRLRSAVHRDDARDEALSVARQQAVNLLSIDYRTADRDIRRIIDGATGQQASIYRTEAKALVTLVQQTKSISTAEVLAAGLVSYDGDEAEAAIAINQSVSSTQETGTVSSARRMVLDLKRVRGRWLVSKQTYVGTGVIL